MSLRSSWLYAASSLLCVAFNAAAQQQAPPTNFGQVAIGDSSSALVLTLNLASPASQPVIYLQRGLDFRAGVQSCTSGTSSCTLSVTFSPRYPGLRSDAAVVADVNGNTLATMLISGTGMGPQSALSPSAFTDLGSVAFSPAAMAVDMSGNLFVASSNNVTERLAGSTITRVIAGQSSNFGSSGDGGPAILATLSNAKGLAVDGEGNLYIADADNNVIRKVDG